MMGADPRPAARYAQTCHKTLPPPALEQGVQQQLSQSSLPVRAGAEHGKLNPG